MLFLNNVKIKLCHCRVVGIVKDSGFYGEVKYVLCLCRGVMDVVFSV